MNIIGFHYRRLPLINKLSVDLRFFVLRISSWAYGTIIGILILNKLLIWKDLNRLLILIQFSLEMKVWYLYGIHSLPIKRILIVALIHLHVKLILLNLQQMIIKNLFSMHYRFICIVKFMFDILKSFVRALFIALQLCQILCELLDEGIREFKL